MHCFSAVEQCFKSMPTSRHNFFACYNNHMKHITSIMINYCCLMAALVQHLSNLTAVQTTADFVTLNTDVQFSEQ